VKRLLTIIMAGVLFGGVLATSAEAGDRGRGRRGRAEVRYYRDSGYRGGYFRPRDVVVIRDYYRPYYRPYHRPAYRYYRGGYLPPGWRTRVVPVPVYVEREFIPVPYGYHRGFIDGHAVVYNSRGFILDIAAAF
jgi:Ni/Co efflux regulator RcnB